MEFTEKQIKDFWKKVDISGPDECWEWKAYRGSSGYGVIRLNKRNYYVHRLAFLFSKGEPKKPSICHSCDNRSCCNPAHLFEGTHSDNMRDCYKKRRHSNIKLTETHIKEIKRLLAEGHTVSSIARRFCIPKMTVSDIKTGKTWSYI